MIPKNVEAAGFEAECGQLLKPEAGPAGARAGVAMAAHQRVVGPRVHAADQHEAHGAQQDAWPEVVVVNINRKETH